MLEEYGIWFSDRLLSGNIAQYIVCLYVLVAGIQFTVYALDNFSEENTKEAFVNYSGYVLNTASSEVILDDFMAYFTEIMGAYVSNYIGNCSDHGSVNMDTIQALCQSSSNNQSCDTNATTDFLCSFAYAATTNESQHNVSERLALLSASGFHVGSMGGAVRVALEEAAELSVDSLYPSSEYM